MGRARLRRRLSLVTLDHSHVLVSTWLFASPDASERGQVFLYQEETQQQQRLQNNKGETGIP